MINVRDIPKIELHCHLDGSMQIASAQRILAAKGEHYTLEQLEKKMRVPESCRSLADFLACFDVPVECLQTAEGLEMAAYDLAVRESIDNVKYFEVRFAPSLSAGTGLKYTEIISCVDAGLKRAEKETGLHTGIIVCAMRDLPLEENMRMFRAAREMLGCGVVGCDLAGDEAAYPLELYRELFALARKLEMPFTIHSGETGNVNNIIEAVELGAQRIGHGVAMRDRNDVMRLCAQHRVGVEVCPTSNLQTCAIRSIAEHPLRRFMEEGVRAIVCTDDMTASGIDINHEFELVQKSFDLTDDEIKQLYRNGIDAAFADDSVKEELWKLWK